VELDAGEVDYGDDRERADEGNGENERGEESFERECRQVEVHQIDERNVGKEEVQIVRCTKEEKTKDEKQIAAEVYTQKMLRKQERFERRARKGERARMKGKDKNGCAEGTLVRDEEEGDGDINYDLLAIEGSIVDHDGEDNYDLIGDTEKEEETEKNEQEEELVAERNEMAITKIHFESVVLDKIEGSAENRIRNNTEEQSTGNQKSLTLTLTYL
jgi:hypothetical protein